MTSKHRSNNVYNAAVPNSSQIPCHRYFNAVRSYCATIHFPIILLVGVFLRLYGIHGQTLLDDEWHALNFVIDKDFFSLIYMQATGANSVPINLYTSMLLSTTGWSELLLRTPSLVCAILGLLIFPLLVRYLWGKYTAYIFGYLFAISPCVIFYSRLSRPYSMVLFFAFLSILLQFVWIKTARKLPLVGFLVSGFLAIWLHLYAAIPVLIPLSVIFTVRFTPFLHRFCVKQVVPSRRQIAFAAGIIGFLLVAIVFPPFIIEPWLSKAFSLSHPTVWTLLEFLQLLSGSSKIAVITGFCISIIAGLWLLIRQELIQGIILWMIFITFFSVMFITTMAGANVGLQVSRHNITMFPIAMLCISIALGNCIQKVASLHALRFVSGITPPLLAIILILAGPLRQIYGHTNNFMHHGIFQQSYAPITWEMTLKRKLNITREGRYTGFLMRKNDIPGIYRDSLKAWNPQGIIEFPVLVGDSYNVYYFYQKQHNLPVIAGFLPELKFPTMVPDDKWVSARAPYDYVLSRIPLEKNHFQNVIPISIRKIVLQRCNGWVLIVHKNPFVEMTSENKAEIHSCNYALYANLVMTKVWGEPTYADSLLAVWKIQ